MIKNIFNRGKETVKCWTPKCFGLQRKKENDLNPDQVSQIATAIQNCADDIKNNTKSPMSLNKTNDITNLCKTIFEIKNSKIKSEFELTLCKTIQSLSAEDFWNIYDQLSTNTDLIAYISYLRTKPVKTGGGFYIG